MGEHNLLNPGFVGPLVNIHTGDTFYFPNFRASGGQLAGLPSLSYPRRENVCSLPWNSSESCNGYHQSYFSNPVSINPSFNRSCSETVRPEEKCFYSAGREAYSDANGNLKREDRIRENTVSDHRVHSGINNSSTFTKYDYGTEHLTPNPPSCPSLESDSCSSINNEGGTNSTSDQQTLITQGNHTNNISTGEGGCLYILNIFVNEKLAYRKGTNICLLNLRNELSFQRRCHRHRFDCRTVAWYRSATRGCPKILHLHQISGMLSFPITETKTSDKKSSDKGCHCSLYLAQAYYQWHQIYQKQYFFII